jgi:hypothetical protein
VSYIRGYRLQRSLHAISETLVLSPINAEKQPYVACTVHFCDNGSSLLVSYLESGFVCVAPFFSFIVLT